jgi:uncharacterized membrane protein YphA (DoxX/SURF4 family)
MNLRQARNFNEHCLWIIQALLALVFLFAGVMKFVTPVEEMTKQMPVAMSGTFLHFIAVCEILGGLGLVLPGLFRIKQGLTPLAAIGLIIIMIGAAVITFKGMPSGAIFPIVVGLLLAFVVYGRRRATTGQGAKASALAARVRRRGANAKQPQLFRRSFYRFALIFRGHDVISSTAPTNCFDTSILSFSKN